MATEMGLLIPQPEEVVLRAIFYNPDSLATLDPATISFEVKEENHEAELDDDVASVCSTVSSRSKKHFFLVDVEKMLDEFSLFAAARDVPSIDTLFSGFRLDSHMESTIKYSMRINESRRLAHIVHYHDQEALRRARQRAERRVYEEKEKQHQRIQQLQPNRNSLSRGNGYSSKTLTSRRKTYHADSSRKHAQKILVLGCGERIDRLAPELNEMLKINGVVVEYQDSLNACATFNILNAKDRRVAAALLPYDPDCA
ncbi:hypothetical protein PsorP6_007445 [Peronosclerospora sorghi]|uniref:Uncharacterized protein n=1 Tax=Peronosclerospora sorghi TaxID=230839 RepID=A0ACC0WBG2_9STRA|nr:hypothetical protein PsorP6_007445 [Peronosclerospora sorghi]